MVRHAALREIVGADALRPVAGTNLALARCGTFRLQAGPLGIIKPRPQNLHRLGAVLVLRFLVLLANDDSGRDVGDPHRRVGGIDRLTARPRRPEDIDPQIAFLNVDIDILSLRQDGNSGSRGVNSATGLGLGNTLHTVNAGLEFQAREDVGAGDIGCRLLVTADPGLGDFHDLETPAVARREPLIHAEQVGSEKRGFIPACAGPNLQNGISRIIPVAWQQKKLQCLHLVGKAGVNFLDLATGHFHDLGIAIRLLDHLRRCVTIRLKAPDKLDLLTDRPKLGQLA